MKVERDPKRCEICGGLFVPRQERSRICNHAECRKIYSKKCRENWESMTALENIIKRPRKAMERKVEVQCLHCKGSFMAYKKGTLYCQKDQCQIARRKRYINKSAVWASKNLSALRAGRHHQNTLVKLERCEPSLMAKILEGWINTIFSEREQVELIFLESSHLRGSRDSPSSEDFNYRGGSVWGGIFPNRGGRA